MNSIIYVGMDVHKASFTLSCFSVTTQETFATVKISPDAKAIKKYLDGVSLSRSEECEVADLFCVSKFICLINIFCKFASTGIHSSKTA